MLNQSLGRGVVSGSNYQRVNPLFFLSIVEGRSEVHTHEIDKMIVDILEEISPIEREKWEEYGED